MDRLVVLREEADPVHARVQLQPYIQRPAQARLFDRLDLPRRMHHAPQLVAVDQFQLAGLEEPLEQQDRPAYAGFAQFQRFLDAGHGKAVGLVGQGLGAPHRAMPVGIRLDHGEGLGSGYFTRQPVVVAQGIEIDQGTSGTHG